MFNLINFVFNLFSNIKEKAFESKEIKNYFEMNIIILMKPISFALNLVNTMLCLMDENGRKLSQKMINF